jgi:hypothetical protein
MYNNLVSPEDVTVDGVKQDLLLAVGVFQAVKLLPGKHTVTFLIPFLFMGVQWLAPQPGGY